jgi:hypothetical protein
MTTSPLNASLHIVPRTGTAISLLFLCFALFLVLFTYPVTSDATEAESSNDTAPATTSSPEAPSTRDEHDKVHLPSDPWKGLIPPGDHFIPPADHYDWLQVTTGEWLKGTLKVFYGEKVEFYSEELDMLEIDSDDVRLFRSGEIKSVRLSGPRTFNGIVSLTKDKIIIDQGGTQKVFDRSELISISSGAESELRKWTIKINLGLDVSSGNTDQTNYSAQADFRRRTAANRFVLNYLGQFSSSQGEDTADNNRLAAYYDIFKSKKIFLRPIFGEYYSDPFQNINNQYTLGFGGGYTFIDTEKTDWNLPLGLAYQQTQFVSVQTGEDNPISTPAFTIGTNYATEITRKINFSGVYHVKLVNKASGSYIHHAMATLEDELTSWLNLDVSVVWDRTENPTPNADGTIPKQNDYKLMFSLGVEY